jgi:hypothetical protein
MHVEMAPWLQETLQLAVLPVMRSVVQALPSSQLAGQLSGGSQVSPGSVTSLPHAAEQSSSVLVVQPAAQQPSPSTQLTIAA